MYRVLLVLTLSLILAGCGWRVKQTPQVVPEDTDTRLGEKTNINLAAWLGKSRTELAKLCDEWSQTVAKQQSSHRRDPDSVIWLRDLNTPIMTPVFRQAKLAAATGFSLPPYLAAGTKDDAVAIHLARYGDHEAAAKLISPQRQGEVEALTGQKNYPVEWTRLVALVQISAAYKLACGDPDGATQLVLVHQQLGKILDKKAAAGPLGRALLPLGRKALASVVEVLRAAKVNKPALADDIDRALKDWGPVPAPTGLVSPGDPATKLIGIFGPTAGKARLAVKEKDRQRAIDLLDWPVPDEGLSTVIAFVDAKDRVAVIQFAYRPKLESAYPFADHLAYHLDEAGILGKDPFKGTSLLRKAYTAGGVRYEAIRVLRGNTVGALVRLSAAKDASPGVGSRDARDLGPVHLDRTFRSARLQLKARGDESSLKVDDPKLLKVLVAQYGTPAPSTATVQRDVNHDVASYVRLGWSSEQLNDHSDRLLVSLWSAFGPGVFAGHEAAGGGYFSLTWETEKTQVQLRLPFDDRGAELVTRDTTPSSKGKARATAALALDEKDRQSRLKANKPWQWVQRSPVRVNGLSLAGVKLGQTRAQTLAALPSSSDVRRKVVPGGVSLLLTSTPQAGWRFWGRQVVLGFDEDDRLAEVRIRYRELAATPASKLPTLSRHLASGQKCAAEAVSADWAGLWADLPLRSKPVKVQWQDDLTTLTYQHDAGGSEAIWRDRDARARPLGWCGRGVGKIVLGATRESLGTPSSKSGEADVFTQSKDSSYESVLVWYAADRVSRVVAVHRPTRGKDGPTQMREAWGKDFDTLGHLRRQEGKSGTAAQVYFWHDDITRVKMFIQGQGDQRRLLTEWRPWPVTPRTAKVVRK